MRKFIQVQTICLFAMSSILTIAVGANAHAARDLEASVACSDADCMFRGTPQTRNAIDEFQKLPMNSGNPRLHNISRYRDNMDYFVDRSLETQFAPIGQLESAEYLNEKGEKMVSLGTAILISPCYVITNHHVAFSGDLRPVPGKDYTMKFKIGAGSADSAFLGHTAATPVAWGTRGACNTNDWAILKLKTCVGDRPDIGWMEVSSKSGKQLVGLDIAVAGYAGDRKAGVLSFSVGKALEVDPANDLVKHSASAAGGQSGGPVMVRENGILKVAGMHTLEFYDRPTNTREFDSYTDQYANEFIPISDIVNRPDIKEMLDQDKAAHGANPAAARHARPIPPWPTT